MCPSINNLVITFVVGDESHVVVSHDLLYIIITLLHQLFFLWRNQYVSQIEGQTTLEGHVITQVLDVVQELSRTGNTTTFDYLTDNVTQGFLTQLNIDITYFCGYIFIDHQTTY